MTVRVFKEEEIAYIKRVYDTRRSHHNLKNRAFEAVPDITLEEISEELVNDRFTLLQKLMMAYNTPSNNVIVSYHVKPPVEMLKSIVNDKLSPLFNRPVRIVERKDMGGVVMYSIYVSDVEEISLTVVITTDYVFDGVLSDLYHGGLPGRTSGKYADDANYIVYGDPNLLDNVKITKTRYGNSIAYSDVYNTFVNADNGTVVILPPYAKLKQCMGHHIISVEVKQFQVYEIGERWVVTLPHDDVEDTTTTLELIEHALTINPTIDQFELEVQLCLPVAMSIKSADHAIETFKVRQKLDTDGWGIYNIQQSIEEIKDSIVCKIVGVGDSDYLRKSIVCKVIYGKEPYTIKQKEYVVEPTPGLKLVFTGPTFLSLDSLNE